MDSRIEKALPTHQEITDWAQALGFQAVGISDVNLVDHEPHVRAYLQARLHGDMGYLERNFDKRLQPSRLQPGTVRVISARMNYLAADTQPLEVLADSSRAYISRYALGRDYHKVLRRKLASLAKRIDAAVSGFEYRAFTDSAPVLEKALGAKAGLGWMGKHTLLLDADAGSWFFLGEIYTSAPLATVAHNPIIDAVNEDPCGKCTACMTVCPTDAIVSPRILDARRCIAYLTIEHKGVIPETFRAAMGNRIFGCDDCQLYCPWNRDAPTTSEPDFTPRHGLENADLIELFLHDEEAFLALTQGSAMRRISYEQWQRNLAVALGNGPPSTAAIAALESVRDSATPLVVEHIDWALARLNAISA